MREAHRVVGNVVQTRVLNLEERVRSDLRHLATLGDQNHVVAFQEPHKAWCVCTYTATTVRLCEAYEYTGRQMVVHVHVHVSCTCVCTCIWYNACIVEDTLLRYVHVILVHAIATTENVLLQVVSTPWHVLVHDTKTHS